MPLAVYFKSNAPVAQYLEGVVGNFIVEIIESSCCVYNCGRADFNDATLRNIKRFHLEDQRLAHRIGRYLQFMTCLYFYGICRKCYVCSISFNDIVCRAGGYSVIFYRCVI